MTPAENPSPAREEGDSRRGDDPGVNHLRAGGSEAARKGAGNPLVRFARVLSQYHPHGVEDFLRTVPKALPILENRGAIQGILPGNSTNAVRAEEFRFSGHSSKSL